MSGMEDFYTRALSNEGVELPLYLPTGEKSEHSIRIAGIDSDVFRKASVEAERDAYKVSDIQDTQERATFIRESKLRLIASLVLSWSFEKECTLKNAMDFLREAPQICDAIDSVATKRKLFFSQKPKN